ADLGAWVSLLSLSGASDPNAHLKLIAGDVQRIQARGDTGMVFEADELRDHKDGEVAFREKAFFEYHLYTLPRTTDVASASTQQLVLFPTARGVAVEKVLV